MTGHQLPLKPDIGHNNPPKTVFDEIDSLYLEAQNWLDGKAIENDAQAQAIGLLMDKIKAAAKLCEAERVEKVTPLNLAKDAIQDIYNPYIGKDVGKAPRALKVAGAVRDKWLQKKQAIIDERARLAREKAAEGKRIADEAMRASRNDLAAREEAEALLEAAKAAERKAIALAKEKPLAIGGRVTVTKKYEPVLTNGFEAAAHYWQTRQSDMMWSLVEFARADVRAGARAIPGFEIREIEV